MPNTRKNNERIRQIEADIDVLAKELYELVQPTDEEKAEALETMRDSSNELYDEPDMVLGPLGICTDVLDQRETQDEDEEGSHADTRE